MRLWSQRRPAQRPAQSSSIWAQLKIETEVPFPASEPHYKRGLAPSEFEASRARFNFSSNFGRSRSLRFLFRSWRIRRKLSQRRRRPKPSTPPMPILISLFSSSVRFSGQTLDLRSNQSNWLGNWLDRCSLPNFMELLSCFWCWDLLAKFWETFAEKWVK